MRERFLCLLRPLPLAGFLTLAAVALSLRLTANARPTPDAALLAIFAGLFALASLSPRRQSHGCDAILLGMLLVALTLIGFGPRGGVTPALLAVWAVCVFDRWPPRRALLALALANLAFGGLLYEQGQPAPLTTVLIYAGFQALGAICVHYARAAEHARDLLAQTNAGLLATRSLLADSTRDAERLRLSRDLHDVAGHKLTALRLNLRALAADPALAGHKEIPVCERLSAELLEDVRRLVRAQRDEHGLDLETALRALAAPLPRPKLQLHIDPQARIADPFLAETLLRVVQEALTNAARHADANVLHVALTRDDDGLLLCIEDDGRVRGVLREGHGLAGMRERLDAARGTLTIDVNAHGALRLEARLPA